MPELPTLGFQLVSQEATRTVDLEFAEIADAVRGFGGWYFDESGRLTVVMQNPQSFDAGALEAALNSVVARRRPRFRSSALNFGEAKVVRGNYSFRQLYNAYHLVVVPTIARVAGVISSDIDEVRNSISIGVMRSSDQAKITSALEKVGMQQGQVRTFVSGLPQPSYLLSDALRPVPGGARIQVEAGDSISACTLGFNLVLYPGSIYDPPAEERYFISNSHCTYAQWSLEYSQADQGGSFAGAEQIDLGGFTGSPCTFGKVCRYSDAAVFLYHDDSISSDDGRVAFPTYEGDTSFTTYKRSRGSTFPTMGWEFIS